MGEEAAKQQPRARRRAKRGGCLFDRPVQQVQKIMAHLLEKPFTLADKLAEATAQDASKFILPSLKAEVNHFKDSVPPVNPLNATAYPMLGLNGRPDIAPPGAVPPKPVSGPSVPKCGARPVDPVSNPFDGLSLEMASYNYKRTSSIMKGAKPGC